MQARWTRPITVATTIEVCAIAILFVVGGWWIGMVGVTAAMASYVGGRTLSTAYLSTRVRRSLRHRGAGAAAASRDQE